MSTRWFLMLTWFAIAVTTGAACTRIDRRRAAQAEEPSPAGARAREPRAETLDERSASAGRTAPRAAQGGRDAGAAASEAEAAPRDSELAIATIADCEAATPLAPASECFDYDPTEPNDSDYPATLPLDTGCGYLEANISAGDEDAFAFTTLRSDPVLIELSYWGKGEADLEQAVFSQTGSLVTDKRTTRMGEGEELRSVIQAAANGTYVVRVRDSRNTASCQSYALRVDPLYCSDEFEDNDSLDAAAKLTWDANEQVVIAGALIDKDEDFFEVTTQRADPVLLTGSYTAGPNSTVQVSRHVYDGAGTLQVSASGKRETETETFGHWLPAPAAGSVLRTRLFGSGSGCATYELTLDGAACTDAYEDNDSASETAPLKLGAETNVTIHRSDEDHYALPELNAGSCSVTYDIPNGRSQQLRLAVYDGGGSLVVTKTGGELNGTVRTLQVSWTNSDAIRVAVVANEGGFCQPYTLRCDAAAGQ